MTNVTRDLEPRLSGMGSIFVGNSPTPTLDSPVVLSVEQD